MNLKHLRILMEPLEFYNYKRRQKMSIERIKAGLEENGMIPKQRSTELRPATDLTTVDHINKMAHLISFWTIILI